MNDRRPEPLPLLLRMAHPLRHGPCSIHGMSKVMPVDAREGATSECPPPDLERECERWEWARAAGVSAQELRRAVQESMAGRKDA